MIETLVATVGLALLMWRRELHWKMFGFLLVMAAWAESNLKKRIERAVS